MACNWLADDAGGGRPLAVSLVTSALEMQKTTPDESVKIVEIEKAA